MFDIQPGEIALTYARREHENTLWIEGEYDINATDQATALLTDLQAIGWATTPGMTEPPPYPSHTGVRVQPFLLTHRGTDMFGGQTPEETTRFQSEANEILTRHGITDVPVWAKTLADLL